MKGKAATGKAILAAAMTGIINLAFAADESVATLVRIEGEAVVSKGAQYVGGSEGMALKVGERVMALASSTATIQFTDGCRYVLGANQLLTIDPKSPCALGLVSDSGTTGAAASPGAAGAAVGAGLVWVPPALGGLVGIASVVASNNDDTSGRRPPPISP
jgi:hypothetical protein